MRTCPNCGKHAINPIKALWNPRCPACGEAARPKYQTLVVITPLVLADVLLPYRPPVLRHFFRSLMLIIPVLLLLRFASLAWAPLQATQENSWRNYTTRERLFVIGALVLLIGVLALADFWTHTGRGF